MNIEQLFSIYSYILYNSFFFIFTIEYRFASVFNSKSIYISFISFEIIAFLKILIELKCEA